MLKVESVTFKPAHISKANKAEVAEELAPQRELLSNMAAIKPSNAKEAMMMFEMISKGFEAIDSRKTKLKQEASKDMWICTATKEGVEMQHWSPTEIAVGAIIKFTEM